MQISTIIFKNKINVTMKYPYFTLIYAYFLGSRNKLFITAMILTFISIVFEYMLYRNVHKVKLFDDEPEADPSTATSGTTFSKIFSRRTTIKQNKDAVSTVNSADGGNSPPQSSLLNTFRKFTKSSVIMDKAWPGKKKSSKQDKLSEILDLSSATLRANNNDSTKEEDLQEINIEDPNNVEGGQVNQTYDQTSEVHNGTSNETSVDVMPTSIKSSNKINNSKLPTATKKNYNDLREKLSRRNTQNT